MSKRRNPPRQSQGGRSDGDHRYRHPVPEPGAVIAVLEKKGVPVSFDVLADALDIAGEQAVRAFRRSLKRMATSGRMLVNRKGEYCLLEKIDGVTGVVSAHRDGFGFLIPDDGSDDVYLSFREMQQILDGDRVAVRVAGSSRGKRAGTVVEILERGKRTVVGRYLREHGVGYVVEAGGAPHHFIVPDHHRHKAAHGQLVKLEIIEYPARRREAQGKIIKVLGETTDPGMATEVAIEQFNLPDSWNASVRQAAKEWGDRVSPADKKDREDLRDLPLVTIDGADARDFDDAVYAEPDGDGWRLIVAIADVSHYVQSGDALDKEAYKRGTSVYFPDRVVPMLPESLSNGLCSLNPDVDRLCMVADMRLTSAGKVTGARFYQAVMKSHARLTYNEVDQALQGKGSGKKLTQLMPQLDHLYGVFRALLSARQRRGALDLDIPEVRIELGSEGKIASIAPRPRNDAHRLIEECMIAANVEAAKFLGRRRLPALYRVHGGPEEDRFEILRLLLQELGIKVTAQARTDPRHLNKVLEAIHGRPDFHVLAMAVLRCMTQAVYQPGRSGHFGLALDTYTHFTSPIRRYPDLLVHRGLKYLIDGGKPAAFEHDLVAMEQLGKICSERERRAEEAARHVEARYKAAYMLDRVGEVMPGTITGVTHFGLFVTLNDVYVEGLIHVTNLNNDYYHAEHGGLRLTGERTGQSFGLGDELQVRIVRVDVDEAKMDFALVDDSSGEKSGRGSRSRRKKN